jgi:hypothetical protein
MFYVTDCNILDTTVRLSLLVHLRNTRTDRQTDVDTPSPKVTRTNTHVYAQAPGHTHTLTRSRTHKHVYNTYCSSTATIVTRTRLSMTIYVHFVSCYVLWTRMCLRKYTDIFFGRSNLKGMIYILSVVNLRVFRTRLEFCQPLLFFFITLHSTSQIFYSIIS